VKRGILYFLGVLSSQQYKTSVIMSDGEGAVGKIQTELNILGIEVDISGAGGHAPRVERRIRVLKERVRTHIHHVPITLSIIGLMYCVLFCVSRLNYMPTSVMYGGISPREAFLGRKPDAKRDFRCSFGDYVIARVPNPDSTMKPRVEDFVVMLPTGNRTGSLRMQSVATGEISTRDHFDIYPMPLSVIARMNEFATRDGRALLKKQTGVLSATMSLTPYVSPHPLPDYITPTPHQGMDPAVTMRDVPAAAPPALQLADEVGLVPHIPPINHHENDAGGCTSSNRARASDWPPRQFSRHPHRRYPHRQRRRHRGRHTHTSSQRDAWTSREWG
jgi:hypothetical protein